MTRPIWLGRAARNRHRHAIEQASRRWRGGRRDDSARTRRKILISTQVVAAVAVLRPQRAPLSRRRSSAPRSISSRIFRNGGSSSSASSCLRPSGAVRDASTAASVANWSNATAPNARQRRVPSCGGARRCARSGRTSIAGRSARSALRQVGAAQSGMVFRAGGSLPRPRTTEDGTRGYAQRVNGLGPKGRTLQLVSWPFAASLVKGA